MIELIKSLMRTNSARLIAYASLAAVAGALKLAELAGVELSAENIAGVSGLAAVVATELIRRFVYSPATTQRIADRAAFTGNTDIGDPPEGPEKVSNPIGPARNYDESDLDLDDPDA